MNFYSITSFIHHCSQSKNLNGIKKFHAHILRTGIVFSSPNLQTKLILTYATCLENNNTSSGQALTNLLKFLNPSNPLPFNSIISIFSQYGRQSLALRTFSYMHFNGVSMDSYAICSSLTSSSNNQNIIFGEVLHALVEKSGWLSSVFVGSALIHLYWKLSCVGNASKVFDEMPVKNTVCVNALLSGLAEAKMWNQGLQLVREIPRFDLDFDHFTFAAALRCSVGLSAMEFGRQIHGSVVRRVWDVGADVFLQTLLIEIYGKCGIVEKAEQIFSMAGFTQEVEKKRDIVLWTSLLGVYGKNGNHKSVIMLFREMLNQGIRPDGVAFLAVISACGHTGQVDLAFEYFTFMTHKFGLIQGPEHYSCLIDSLCRAGELEKAWKLVNDLPCEKTNNCNVALWGTLLSACSEFGNIDLGKLAGQRALQLEPQNTGIIALLSNMYAKHGMWDEFEQLRDSMKGRKIIKDTGRSWIGVA